MKIVKCTYEHLDELSAFFDKVTTHLCNNINYPKWIPNVYPGRESCKLAIENKYQYACIKNGRIVGAVILNDNPQGHYEAGEWQVNLKQGEYMVIHTLATDPDLYNQGISKFLVEFCIMHAKSQGYKAVRLDVVPGNIPAVKLYEKLGFKYAGEKDLKRFEHIPTFLLYELNFTKDV